MKEDWAQFWDIAGAAAYIAERGFSVAALQFPDDLLRQAPAVARALQDACAAAGLDIQAFVMADTTYNSLGVDEVAAQHANAHCVIHYGRASLSPLSRLPAYFVFTRTPIEAQSAAARIATWAASEQGMQALAGKQAVLVLPDLPLIWAVAQLRERLAAAAAEEGLELPIVVADVPTCMLEPGAGSPTSGAAALPEGLESPPEPAGRARSSAAAGLTWRLPAGVEAGDCLWLWLGQDDAPALTELLMTHSREQWVRFSPATGVMQEGVPQDILRTLRRRTYLVERARNANIVGIVVGTLGVAGYLAAAEEVRRLARAAGKRTHTLLMGKPSPAKLANFPEVDVFVMVADAQGQILDSKEFYAPLITPFEAQLAFGPEGAAPARYSLDFDALLAAPTSGAGMLQQEPRFSLIDGGYHEQTAPGEEDSPSSALSERVARSLSQRAGPGQLVTVTTAAEYLTLRRGYQGLETPYTGAAAKPVTEAVEGRSGRAAGYEDEPMA